MGEHIPMWGWIAFGLLHMTLGYAVAFAKCLKEIRKLHAEKLDQGKRLAMAEIVLQRVTNSDPAKLIDAELAHYERYSYQRMVCEAMQKLERPR